MYILISFEINLDLLREIKFSFLLLILIVEGKMLSELIRSQEEQIIFEALRAGLMGYNHRCSYNQFKSISKDSGRSGTSYFLQFQFFEIELFVFAALVSFSLLASSKLSIAEPSCRVISGT